MRKIGSPDGHLANLWVEERQALALSHTLAEQMRKDMVLFVKPQLVVSGNRTDQKAERA